MASFDRTTPGPGRLLGAPSWWRGTLPELDRYICVPVGSDHPRGGDVAVWAHDVGAMVGAVHEHRVQLGIVDPSAPPPDVFTGLLAQAARQVRVRTICM